VLGVEVEGELLEVEPDSFDLILALVLDPNPEPSTKAAGPRSFARSGGVGGASGLYFVSRKEYNRPLLVSESPKEGKK